MKHKCYRCPAIYGSPDPGWSHDDEPCTCSCQSCLEYKRMQALPDVTDEELTEVFSMVEDTTAGPWEPAQFNLFGADRFLVSKSELRSGGPTVVAHLRNPGSFKGDEFMAWCRDGVPRLIRKIRQLQKDNAYVESWRKKAADERGAWEHQILVKADLESKIRDLEERVRELEDQRNDLEMRLQDCKDGI